MAGGPLNLFRISTLYDPSFPTPLLYILQPKVAPLTIIFPIHLLP